MWYDQPTAFPHIVSAETILFLIWKLQKIWIVAANFNFLHNKLNFCCGNYSREETIQGRKLFAEIRYLVDTISFLFRIFTNAIQYPHIWWRVLINSRFYACNNTYLLFSKLEILDTVVKRYLENLFGHVKLVLRYFWIIHFTIRPSLDKG